MEHLPLCCDPPRIIDLSVPLANEAVSEPMPAQIRYVEHAGDGLAQMQIVLRHQAGGPGLFRRLRLGHRRDPGHHAHRHSCRRAVSLRPDLGRTARARIDEVPLEWCLAPGVVLDVRHKAAGEFITVEDLQAALQRIDYTLKPLDIVLLQTGADKRLDSPDYFAQPGLGREGTLWLVEQGVKVIGIDAYTLDRPFADMVGDYQRTGDGRYIWPAHFAGIEREYCQIEKLANLDQIPQPHGFYVSCLPVKIEKASAGWCRAVARVFE